MKFAIALAIALASFGSSISAFADSQDTTVTTVPFDFVAGSKTFSAGKYFISRLSSDNSHGALLIRSTDGATAILIPTTSESVADNDSPRLVFQRDRDTYFLSQIVAELSTYTLATHRPDMRMAAAGVSVTASPSP